MTMRTQTESIWRFGRFQRTNQISPVENLHGKGHENLSAIDKLGERKSCRRLICTARFCWKQFYGQIFVNAGNMEDEESLCRKGRIYVRQIEKYLASNHNAGSNNNDDFDVIQCFDEAKETFRRGIDMSFEIGCTHAGAHLRLEYASLLARVMVAGLVPTDEYKDEAETILNWIISNGRILGKDFVIRAQRIKPQIEDADFIQVVKAMNVITGYNYGGRWTDHWFECPNGHPYFIGECARAGVESKCIECGARVGGTEHRLLGGNRPANALITRTRGMIQ